eukprot:9441613-Alexandrium_andersonii.AAC.1
MRARARPHTTWWHCSAAPTDWWEPTGADCTNMSMPTFRLIARSMSCRPASASPRRWSLG